MAWHSSSNLAHFRAPLRGACALLATMLLAGCMFMDEGSSSLVQNPVSPLIVHIGVGQITGASHGPAPTLALVYQCYYSNGFEAVETKGVVDSFPKTFPLTFSGPLPVAMVDCGLSQGYTDGVLTIIFPAVFDDINFDGVKAENEQWVGASNERIVVYFQGVLSTELADQFGQLEQGYSVLSKVGQINGVDLYRPVGHNDVNIALMLPKSAIEVKFPKLR
jgi:hypothetical protein